jgi:predicted GIY-YIG superfamily endonuclease
VAGHVTNILAGGYAWQATTSNFCPAELSRAKQSMGMFYVYILRSESHLDQTYVGLTQNLKQRLLTHNQGGSPHTAKFAPWQTEFYCAFKEEHRARQFELYLKSHSGKAFASKRLL